MVPVNASGTSGVPGDPGALVDLLDVDIEGAGVFERLALQLACAGQPASARPATPSLQVPTAYQVEV
jgi:hypothetical protein